MIMALNIPDEWSVVKVDSDSTVGKLILD